MADISGGGGGGGGSAYTYVQDTQPSGPEEGESWYDTAGNAAFVYDGAAWIEQTVADHADLSGVGASDHHTRPTGTGSYSERRREYNIAQVDGGSRTVPIHAVTDEIHYDFDGSNSTASSVIYDIIVYDLSGSQIASDSAEIAGGSSGGGSFNWNSPVHVSEIYLSSDNNGGYCRIDDFFIVTDASHSHSI